MNAQKIAYDEWGRFCERFSREHHGWLVSVAITATPQNNSGESRTTKILARNLPLQEVRESQSQDQVEIMITVGNGTDEISFLVENVAEVFQNVEENKHLGLRIDSADSASTVVQFRAPANPGQLDGLAQSDI
jgi:hypothetical protein